MQSPSLVNDEKVHSLFQQAAVQQWAAHKDLDFTSPLEIAPEVKEVWGDLATVFYTLEKMGLSVLNNMYAKAAHELHSEDTLMYLIMQCADEGRHVYAIENYLARLGRAPQYERKYHVLGQVASLGFYRVENWLFSTLFSENFASAFLRRAKSAPIDPLGAEMCKKILKDESRHLHFLHIVLPDVMDRMSLFGKAYVKLSQRFILNFTEKTTRSLADKASVIGIDRRELLEEVFENVEKAYQQFGVTKNFLSFPAIH